MQSFKAHVRDGRLVLDEPTTLPEGAEVELTIVGGDELDDEERAALHASIDESIEDEEAGNVEDFSAVLLALRDRR